MTAVDAVVLDPRLKFKVFKVLWTRNIPPLVIGYNDMYKWQL